jgi:enoyl-CoA hydratase/carnithine racemase
MVTPTEEFVDLFHQISQDAENRVVILTGAGKAFIDNIDAEGFDFYSPRGYDKIYREGKKVLLNLIDIPVPVIAALNAPTTVHSEYALLADIIIATPDTVFQDKPHFAFGIVPGDGIHSLWPEVLGSIRGRTFVLTQQIIGVKEEKALGVISEIVARDRLLQRAREIAGRIANLPPLTASYTRVALTQKLRRVVDESVELRAGVGRDFRGRRRTLAGSLRRRSSDENKIAPPARAFLRSSIERGTRTIGFAEPRCRNGPGPSLWRRMVAVPRMMTKRGSG